jgi:molybdenum cofactor cytidylyltransferase
MRKPKQLLEFNGKTLLQHAIQTALGSVCRPIVAVLGSGSDRLKTELEDFNVLFAENFEWKNGMSSSIKVGLQKLLDSEDQINGVLIMVCDQPLVSSELINQIVETQQHTGSLIVASQYVKTLGVPALFSHLLFPHLFNLENIGGAKKLIKKFKNQTSAVNFPGGEFDIDTPEDYQKLTKIKK